MTTTVHITTAEQLLEAGGIGPCELVRGKLIMMTPAGPDHGDFASEIDCRLRLYVKTHKLGKAYTSETGFILARRPDTVRAPDVAFVRSARVRPHGKRGYFEGAPDLAVEVLSPSNSAGELQDRLRDYLSAGAGAVWVIDPDHETITVYTPSAPPVALSGQDRLRGGDVLPGFELVVAEYFADVKES